jgi:hypothetical protein
MLRLWLNRFRVAEGLTVARLLEASAQPPLCESSCGIPCA